VNVAQKPDVKQILSRLKDFQRRTVDYVIRRLYHDPDRVNRFLVADEVGLGKIMVARGVIARAIEELWDKVDRIDIVYICANAEIARQNLNRLDIDSDRTIAFSTRLTLLPMQIHDLRGNKLNFVSFTPGTSFDLRSREGMAEERALIYHMLRMGWQFGDRAGPKNLMQCHVQRSDSWRERLDRFPSGRIDRGLQDALMEELTKRPEIRKRFDHLADRFGYSRKHVPYRDRREQLELVGDLRRALAEACVNELEPDLVIMDEFQRFTDLLYGNDEVASLAETLYSYPGAKVLLLSATPYKMYTIYHETEDSDHYEDFVSAVRFLQDSPEVTRAFEGKLARYRRELLSFEPEHADGLDEAKHDVEQELRQVMCRTERLAVTEDRDGMVSESPGDLSMPTAQELRSYAALDAVARALDVTEPIEYWKSAPYVLSIMDRQGYKLKERFVKALAELEAAGAGRSSTAGRSTDADSEVDAGVDVGAGAQVDARATAEFAAVLGKCRNSMLSWKTVKRFDRVDPGNARLRTLMSQKIDPGAWQLLWLPPSLPYYEVPSGPYSDPTLQGFTKGLVFSSWKVVPKAIAILCSYEAERLMIASAGQQADYQEISRLRTLPLRFPIVGGKPGGMSTFTLLYPCLTLAEAVDPLMIGLELVGTEFPGLKEIQGIVAQKLEGLLAPIIAQHARNTSRSGLPDPSWYWAALPLLDKKYHPREVGNWLRHQSDDLAWGEMARDFRDPETHTGFAGHVDAFSRLIKEPSSLGRPPDDLVTVVTKIALGSPAVTALRALRRSCRTEAEAGHAEGAGHVERAAHVESTRPMQTDHLLAASARVALGFRSLFNLHDSVALLRSMGRAHGSGPNGDSDVERYWEVVLDYCLSGNLQALLDEYVHILRDSLGVTDKSHGVALRELADEMEATVSIRAVNLDFDDLEPGQPYFVKSHSLRCRYALRYGDYRSSEDESATRADQVRRAFNSPFKPFILASTSIGQEGLDFHQYCHDIYHWNLPSNPVDLEQREGRVHRYKGHAIRKNVAGIFGLRSLLGRVSDGEDPWLALFELAASTRGPGCCELVPYWVYEFEGGHKVVRHIPALPLSRELAQIDGLRRTLAVYRMVLGQPRQEDLVGYLSQRAEGGLSTDELLRFRVDLAP